jgi:hypothetical protein
MLLGTHRRIMAGDRSRSPESMGGEPLVWYYRIRGHWFPLDQLERDHAVRGALRKVAAIKIKIK